MKTNTKGISLSLLFLLLLSSCGKKTYQVEDYRLTLEYHNSFNIVQWTDLHVGLQSDTNEVFNLLTKQVENSRLLFGETDLLILTGDTFMGADKKQVRDTFRFIDSLEIPFAFTYGNHDLHSSYSKYYIQDTIMKCKNALFIDYKDDDLTGMTNYFIDLVSNDKTEYRIYIIDSNSYHADMFSLDYDVIHEDQIKHMENIASTYGKVPSLAFFHIPFYEFDVAYNLYLKDEIKGSGTHDEPVSYPYKKTDAYQRMKDINVKGMFVGHDHVNDTTLDYHDTILSYGLKSTHEIYSDRIGYTWINLKGDGALTLEDVTKVYYEGEIV